MGRPITFSDDDIALIRRMAAAQVQVVEIAKMLQRSPKGIYCLMTRLGIPRQPRNRFGTGEKNHSWNGGQWIDADGYVMIYSPDHPFRTYGCYVREHRLVMEASLRRYLGPKEVVHHVDGNKKNNAIENLQLFQSNGEHLKMELTGRIPKWTPEGRRRILESVRRPKVATAASTPPASIIDDSASP